MLVLHIYILGYLRFGRQLWIPCFRYLRDYKTHKKYYVKDALALSYIHGLQSRSKCVCRVTCDMFTGHLASVIQLCHQFCNKLQIVFYAWECFYMFFLNCFIFLERNKLDLGGVSRQQPSEHTLMCVSLETRVHSA